MLSHFVLVLHFAAIVTTFCVSITICGGYYILRRNKDFDHRNNQLMLLTGALLVVNRNTTILKKS